MKPPTLSRYALCCLGRALLAAPALVRGIDRRLREEIILHVSSVNSCPVCSAVHGFWAHRIGLTDSEIAHARDVNVDGWDHRTRVALRYAELRTADHEREHPEDVAAFEREFSTRERAAVRAFVDFFTFTNRFNNTWERLLPGAAARRQRLNIEH
ncbi:MAG: Carboxymuconolactone decarboxylase family [Deltaproteobacteria bacterium]|nr:Carboxymuconolactone decarboxylase family [Deltaproteobacteria bacterium]